MTDKLEYEGGARRRIKQGLDMEKLRETGSCTFEIQGSDDDEHEEEERLKEEAVDEKKGFFDDVSLKNLPVVTCSAEEALTDFDEMQSSWKSIFDGVQKKVYRPGRGEAVPEGAKVWIHYIAYHELSDECYDSSINDKRPLAFRLGEGNVIRGLEIGVNTMEKKEISKFLIQPKLAYGPLGCPPKIPADSRILFTVELLDFQIVAQSSKIFEMTVEERAELPFSEIYKAAEELKYDGKLEFEAQNFQEAVSFYSRAAKMLEEYFLTTSEQEEQKNRVLYILFNNLAVCYLKLDKPKKAINAAKSALDIPIEVKRDKPYYSLCKAYFALGKTEEAKEMADEALKISPNHTETIKLYNIVMKKLRDDGMSESSLCKKMMKSIVL